ncbi:hypothetical protein, partial [Aquabacterium sp.]|uniref:hypothetical protein n=1 Tax=Aquabacterium sp. TaxID=1872578 RepID=UPI0025C4A66C
MSQLTDTDREPTMPRPPQTAELAALRARRVQADAALARQIAEVEQTRRQRDRLVSQGASAADIATASLGHKQARQAYEAGRAQRDKLLQAVTALSAAAAQAGDDAQGAALFSHLEGDTPLLLFPVRLETRYERQGQNPPDLLVRIYPDAAQVQRHLQALTEVEQTAGRAYWAARFARLGQPAPQTEPERMRDQRPQALWAEMVKALRAPRAAYVVNRTRPLNAHLLDQADAALAAPAEPDFPAPEPAGSRLAAQPTAVMLPDRFCVVGLAQGGRIVFRRFGAPVPDVLPMAPAIEPGDAAPADQTPGPFEGEAAWLARFDQAVERGMGLRVRQADVDAFRQAHPGTPAFSLNEPIERLVVLGVDWTLTPEQAAAGVTALFEAQAASAGIGFLPIGMPTNNTSAASSGHSPAQLRDPSLASPTPPAAGTSAVETLRFALGLPDEGFAQVAIPQGDLDDAALSGHMLNALYAGTMGAYLREAWDADHGPFKLSEDTHEAIRAHVVTHLRPTGPLQPLRIDSQPYGLLPIVAPQRYRGADAFETGLARVLGTLRPKWEQVQDQVPRFDGATAHTHALLQHGPWAQSAAYRRVEKDATISPALTALSTFQQGLRDLPGGLFMQTLAATWGAASARAEVLSALPLARMVLQADASILPRAMPWVQADSQVPTREADGAAPAPAYLTQLTEAIDRHVDLKQAFAGLRQAPSLLQGLLAWSADREADVGNAALLGQVTQAVVAGSTTRLLKTPLTLGVAQATEQTTAFEVEHVGQIAGLRLKGVTGDAPIGQHVARAASVAAQQAQAEGRPVAYAPWHRSHRAAELEAWRTRLPRPVRHLASVRASLGELSERTVGELNWALRSALDAFDHRLDAWYTSLATRRLATLRAGQNGQRQQGLQVGAFGWVEWLQPDAIGTRESQGHMLMPSLRHGAAAAVLRSGYLNGDAAERRTFSLDLSSRRVRAARDLFEGLTLGQPIAVQLGYRFERGLRDAGLAAYITGFRRALPLRAPAGGGNEAPPEPEARDVVDGAGRPRATISLRSP